VPSIHELVASARRRLRDAGIPGAEADRDARVIAQCLLQWDAARYFTDAIQPAPDAFTNAYGSAIDRRVQREPVAYITGFQEFWGLPFEVSPAVLIPRPETELIVEACLEWWTEADTARRVADVCTGSGCLAVALACERPAAVIVATDISRDALGVALHNAARHAVDSRIQFIETDLLTGVTGAFDLIVSNPPYVPASERATLEPEVLEHEPHLALFGGADGLFLIEALVRQAAARLAPSGRLFFEFGIGQANAVSRIVADAPSLELLEFRRDLQGIPRTAVVARTP
jgi:release factor glutamine methyltransferase